MEEPHWVESLCSIASRWKQPGTTILGLFREAAPDLSEPPSFDRLVKARLGHATMLVDAWQNYSWDKRTTPSPYLDGLEVGFYDAGRHDVVEHRDRVDACADFIHREANWVLRRERVAAP
jgi:hypothetical protein